jgi:hypothetical protein
VYDEHASDAGGFFLVVRVREFMRVEESFLSLKWGSVAPKASARSPSSPSFPGQ